VVVKAELNGPRKIGKELKGLELKEELKRLELKEESRELKEELID